MMHDDIEKYGFSLKTMDTVELDKLMSRVMHEMRRRDSDHVRGDVVSSSQALRKLRSTDKLP
jgi:hypothetical protein